MKITLRVFNDGGEILSKSLGEGVFRAGRSEFCDVVLPDDQVSRAAVELRVNEVAVYFTNMSSPGQVKLNGKAKETGEIADGDELAIGMLSFYVQSYADQDESSEAREHELHHDEAARHERAVLV